MIPVKGKLPHGSGASIMQAKVVWASCRLSLFEVYDGDPLPLIELKTQTLAEFEEGVALYHQEKLAQAQELFLSVLQINDQDKAARFYVERCEQLQTYGISQGWEAIETLHEKL